MKHLISLTIILVFSLSFLFSRVVPESAKVGRVCVEVEEGSVEEMVLRALKEEFSLSWIENYCDESDAFLAAYSETLSSILPMENVIMGEFDGNGLYFYSQDTPGCFYFVIKEGRITALQKK